jgi:hypothetical protein
MVPQGSSWSHGDMDQDEQGDSRAHEVTFDAGADDLVIRDKTQQLTDPHPRVPPSALKYLGADDDVLVRVRLLWTRQMKI